VGPVQDRENHRERCVSSAKGERRQYLVGSRASIGKVGHRKKRGWVSGTPEAPGAFKEGGLNSKLATKLKSAGTERDERVPNETPAAPNESNSS